MLSRSTSAAAMALAAGTVFLSPASHACCPGEPHEIRPVMLEKVDGGITRLQWVPQGGFFSDVVRGSLRTLAQTGGDYIAAVEGCVGEDRVYGLFDDAAIPAPGDGFWYLIRSDQRDGCPGGIDGSYDSVGSHQAGDRDVEIRDSGLGCTCYYGEQGYGCFLY